MSQEVRVFLYCPCGQTGHVVHDGGILPIFACVPEGFYQRLSRKAPCNKTEIVCDACGRVHPIAQSAARS